MQAKAKSRAAYIGVLHVRAKSLYSAAMQSWVRYSVHRAERRAVISQAEAHFARSCATRAILAWIRAVE
eukprot:scaffold648724_cov51-Prasinocladus_malaysianus.AAC.1